MARTVEIETLNLRIPGLNRDQARRAGREVAEHVSRGLSTHGRSQQLGAINMRVKVLVGTPSDQIPKLIALAILEKLG
jgi:hypothetical protein